MRIIVLVFSFFALIHSITATRRFKLACERLFGDTFMRVWYRALYVAVSIVTAIIAMFLIQRVSDQEIGSAPAVLRWSLRVVQAAGFAFGAFSFEHLNAGEFMGFQQVRRYLTRREVAGNIEGMTDEELVTTGVYGIVRHPLYLAGIVIFTCNPHITANGLALTILADLYFLLGTFVEERRFLLLFGDRYREYMLRVPRLIPKVHISRR